MARARVWEHEQNNTAKIRKPPTPQPELFSLEEEPGGGLPAPLSEVAGRQGKVERHVVEDLGELAPLLQILDLPVPQMVDNVLDALRILDFPMVVQVIEVPKVLIDVFLARSLVPEPQTAEQLVEVPTVLSPTRIALQIAEQIVDTSVPQGRGGKRRVQGFLPEPSSIVTSSCLERISERPVEQIVDIPSSGGGLVQGSSSSACPADVDFTGGFSHSSPWKKVRNAGQVVSAQLGGHVSSSTLSAHQMPRAGEHADSVEWVELYDDVKSKTFYWNRRSNETLWQSRLRVSRSSGSGSRRKGEVSGTGTGVLVLVRLSSLRCLLSDGLRDEGLGIPSPLLGCHQVRGAHRTPVWTSM